MGSGGGEVDKCVSRGDRMTIKWKVEGGCVGRKSRRPDELKIIGILFSSKVLAGIWGVLEMGSSQLIRYGEKKKFDIKSF